MASTVYETDNYITTYNFAHLAANDVKGRQVAIGNGASCPRKQNNLKVKTWSPDFPRA